MINRRTCATSGLSLRHSDLQWVALASIPASLPVRHRLTTVIWVRSLCRQVNRVALSNRLCTLSTSFSPDRSTGGFCDSDVFFGAIWFQRVKQYCLLNGIAVMEVNNFVRDGWESWGAIWNGGYDPPFFAALVDAMNGRPHRSGILPPSECLTSTTFVHWLDSCVPLHPSFALTARVSCSHTALHGCCCAV